MKPSKEYIDHLRKVYNIDGEMPDDQVLDSVKSKRGIEFTNEKSLLYFVGKFFNNFITYFIFFSIILISASLLIAMVASPFILSSYIFGRESIVGNLIASLISLSIILSLFSLDKD